MAQSTARRLGRIVISDQLYEDEPLIILLLQAKVRFISKTYDSIRWVYNFIAESNHFDILEPSEDIPRYRVIIHNIRVNNLKVIRRFTFERE